jgi:hypothetical protein
MSQCAGYAFFRAINARDPQSPQVGMWRMSHAACSAGAVLLIALAPVAPHLRLSPKLAVVLTYSLVVSTHALSVGTIVAACSGHRGTRPRGPIPNLAVYLLYMVGALGSSLSALVFAYGAAGAYFAPTSTPL